MQISMEPRLLVQRQKARLTAEADGSFVLADGKAKGHQSVAFQHADLRRALLRLRVELRPLDGASANFCVFHDGRRLLASVGRDGILQASADPELLEASCRMDASGALQLDLQFRNFGPALLLALAKPGGSYRGTGQPQFALRDFRIDVLERRWTPSPEDGLVVLQAGAPTDPVWTSLQDGLRMILCDADQEAGQAALAALAAPERHILLTNTLSNRNGAAKLNVARDPAMTSLLDPDLRRVKPFAIAESFDVTGGDKVPLARYDTLSRQHNLPTPDLLRIRAGGAEYDVLRGCGDILDSALAIEVQAHFYPLYRKQKLLGDILDLLDGHGFALRRLLPDPVAATAHELVAATAYLTRRKVEGPALNKLAFIEEVWGVSWPR